MGPSKRPLPEPAVEPADVAADAEAAEPAESTPGKKTQGPTPNAEAAEPAESTPGKKTQAPMPNAPRRPSAKEAREAAEEVRLAKFETWRNKLGLYLAAGAMDAEAELGEPAAHMADLISNLDKYFPATPAGYYCSGAENARRAGD